MGTPPEKPLKFDVNDGLPLFLDFGYGNHVSMYGGTVCQENTTMFKEQIQRFGGEVLALDAGKKC